MADKVLEIKSILDQLSPQELEHLTEYLRDKLPRHPVEQEWNIRAEVILDSIQRSQDITKRGVRGIIAECVFERSVLPKIVGWQQVPEQGDLPYDFKIRSEKHSDITIQVKLQRMEKGKPLSAIDQKRLFPGGCWIVEVQKTRSGEELAQEANNDEVSADVPSVGEASQEKKATVDVKNKGKSTRPYKFGEFDILAVNLQPSTGDWSKFMYTVASWLLERPREPALIAVMQPVAAIPNDVWTDDINTCISWLIVGEKLKIFDVETATKFQIAERERIRAERKAKLKEQKAAAKAMREADRAAGRLRRTAPTNPKSEDS
jgi:hypothetical protein